MKIVTPESWYRIYWTCMGLGFMAVGYFMIKWAILAAYIEILLMRAGQ